MSYPIMSALPISMAKGLKKTQHWPNILQKVAAGRGNCGLSLSPFPWYDFEFDMDAAQGNEAALASIVESFKGTFAVCQGTAGLFLFTDPQDSVVSYANSGMLDVTPNSATPMSNEGNGSSTQYQLVRSIGGVAWDVIQALNGSITLQVNGSVVANYSVSSTGVVTFTPTGSPAVAAPPNNATLQWAGSFYFPCRFAENTYDGTRIFTTNSGTDLWDISGIKFSSEMI